MRRSSRECVLQEFIYREALVNPELPGRVNQAVASSFLLYNNGLSDQLSAWGGFWPPGRSCERWGVIATIHIKTVLYQKLNDNPPPEGGQA